MWTDEQCEENGLVRAIVARGRSVQTSVPGSGKPDADNPRRVTGTVSRRFRPGEVVWLEPGEAQRLRGLGFVLDLTDEGDAAIVAAMLAPSQTDAPRRVTPEPQQTLRFDK
ncbi:hypothetical protein [Paraburkholderia youngii]|uniref:Uncharacterized protein n=1 Tax=Paraburkholderia youngii TaxID=2782701 RepID=A0A7Y6K0M8_9BURK|nr:hypothetical protein [Paraburkholderia youngii]NUY01701.1 hypothetical protein [Paraburkholderia youngii]